MMNASLNKIVILLGILLALAVLIFSLSGIGKPKHFSRINGFNLVAPPHQFPIDSLKKVSATGAEWVAIIPYAFCNAQTGQITFDHPRQWWGERPKGIINTIEMAHQLGLKVMLKPHLWVGGQGWAGDLSFSEESLWLKFENEFSRYLLTYAEIADSMNVEMLCIGTEMRKSTQKRPDYWFDLIETVKSNYKGALTYAANWDEYEKITFWEELDYIGIDAYFPLSMEKNPSKEELIEQWNRPIAAIQKVSQQNARPVLFTEYGYESIDYTTAGHWNFNIDTLELNFGAQKTAFEALHASFKNKSWWKGGFIWKWHLTQNGLEDRTIRAYTPQSKPAMEVISKKLFTKN